MRARNNLWEASTPYKCTITFVHAKERAREIFTLRNVSHTHTHTAVKRRAKKIDVGPLCLCIYCPGAATTGNVRFVAFCGTVHICKCEEVFFSLLVFAVGYLSLPLTLSLSLSGYLNRIFVATMSFREWAISLIAFKQCTHTTHTHDAHNHGTTR